MSTTDAKSYSCMDPHTASYAAKLLDREDPVLAGVRDRARAAGLPDIHVNASDGRHLQVLAAACGAKKAVEVGTLAGYSGVCLLRGMGPQGVLHTLELDPAHVAVAAETFKQAGVSHQAHIHQGKAAQTLETLNGQGPFDLVFIDADKPNYPVYLAWAAQHLRIGGVVLADNVFLWGTLARPTSALLAAPPDPAIPAMKGFNATVVDSDRFVGTLLPTGEGLAMGVKIR